MRAPLIGLCFAALLAAGASAAAPGTSLRIDYRADADAPVRRWTLTCAPAGGTHPAPARACRQLAALGSVAFAPVPKDTACAEIYGGPQDAVVSGHVGGRRVWARFRRRDGCEIARWKRHDALFPAVGAP